MHKKLSRLIEPNLQPYFFCLATFAGVTAPFQPVLAAVELARRLEGKAPVDFPRETALGALSLYISDETVKDFQPMNINFGIISPLGYRVKGKRNKNQEISQRSLEIIEKLKPEILI